MRVDADADYGHLKYRSIGPAIAGGRVAAVAGSDRDPFLYYVGGAGGGVFKSVDGGTTWRQTYPGLQVPAGPTGAEPACLFAGGASNCGAGV